MLSFLKKCLDFLTSMRLTVGCLIWLSVLVFWGTLYQVDHGLYQAQRDFYYSWFVLVFKFVPLPGGMLVMWLLFINLLISMMTQFRYGWRRSGIVLIHFGVLLMLAGGWITHLFGQESFLTLREGESSNVSASYHDWELSAWKGQGSARKIVAVDIDHLRAGQKIDFNDLGFTLEVDAFYPHCRAMLGEPGAAAEPVINGSGITRLDPEQPGKDPQTHVPGLSLRIRNGVDPPARVLLYGGENQATLIPLEQEQVALQLRRKRFPLPVVVQLIDFKKEVHPNTETPKSFSSMVAVSKQDLQREVLIEMNRPFRYKTFTFFQASYSSPQDGREISTFAVTQNYGRLVPYVATAVTSLGLIVHFLVALYRPRPSSVVVGA